ncbi:RNA-guided endonuclease InsQ/TnpB family protein [Streptomyces lavendulae]|uniref:RNA-guided endonuclease InsQ/TnpB family protein n=1 Tax=Streptomyces lavendulae TaxID=1914 RepID=UPI003F4D6E85
MTIAATVGGAGHARYTYRLRVSSTALARLEGEWARCRWVWNECVAVSRKVHGLNRTATEKITCGPAQLDRMPTGARQGMAWLHAGSSVPQQQVIRDFAKSRSKALGDIKARLPMRQRAGMPRIKRKREAAPSLNYTRRGFRLRDGRLHLAGGIVPSVVWSRDLPAAPSSVRVHRDGLGHWYASFVVATESQPLPPAGAVIGIDWGVKETATTTSDAHDLPHAEHGKTAAQRLARYQRMMARRRTPKNRPDTSGCGARAKHALPLSERTYTCTACGAVSPRDKNSARVMLVRAGLNPAGADLVRPAPCQGTGEVSQESPSFTRGRSQNRRP